MIVHMFVFGKFLNILYFNHLGFVSQPISQSSNHQTNKIFETVLENNFTTCSTAVHYINMKFIWKKYFFELFFMFRVTDSLTVDTLGNMRLVVGDFTTTSRNRKTLKIYRKLNKGVKIRFFVSCLFVFEP